MHQPKNIENTCFPPQKRILLNFSVSPFVSPGLLGFLFRILFRIPFLNFLLLNLMFLVSSFSLVFFFFPSIFSCPLSPFFSSSPVSVFLFVHVMLALLVPFYVCSDVFSCSCFFFPSSLVNHLLQLTSVFPLIGLVLFLLSSRLPCSSLFSSFSSSFLLLLLLLLLLVFFLFFLFFSCSSVLRSKLRWWRFTSLLFCVFGSFFLGSSIENGPTTTKRQKLRTIFWHFCIQGIFSKKPSAPRVWGFVSAVLLHKSAIFRLLSQPLKRKCTRETLQK